MAILVCCTFEYSNSCKKIKNQYLIFSVPGNLAEYLLSYLMAKFNLNPFSGKGGTCLLWQYELWSFQMGYTKLERFLSKNQHTQRKLMNFEFWING